MRRPAASPASLLSGPAVCAQATAKGPHATHGLEHSLQAPNSRQGQPSNSRQGAQLQPANCCQDAAYSWRQGGMQSPAGGNGLWMRRRCGRQGHVAKRKARPRFAPSGGGSAAKICHQRVAAGKRTSPVAA